MLAQAGSLLTNHIAPGRSTLAPFRCAANASRRDVVAVETRTSETRCGSVKANIPGAFGIGFGRGGKWRETAFIGTSIHGFSASRRQHTNLIRAPEPEELRMLAKAATGSPKNIMPKADVSKSKPSSVVVAASACRQSTLAMPVAVARAFPQPALAQRCPTPCAREFQRGRATAATDVQHPLAGARCGEGEQRLRHRR